MIEPELYRRIGHGLQTGFVDTDGKFVYVGDIVRIPVDTNSEFHGEWSEWVVELRNTVPVLVYLRSEHGNLMPRGYLVRYLAEQYDRESVFYSKSTAAVRPIEAMRVTGKEPKRRES